MIIEDYESTCKCPDKKEIKSIIERLEEMEKSIKAVDAKADNNASSISIINNTTFPDEIRRSKNYSNNAVYEAITALKSALSTQTNTQQIISPYGSIAKVKADEVEATEITADNITVASITADNITTPAVDIDEISTDSLTAETANIDAANIKSLTVKDYSIENLYTTDIDTKDITAETVDAERINGDVITVSDDGRWHEPTGTPDNTHLLRIAVPRYYGIVNIISEDGKLNITIYNGELVSFSQTSTFIYNISFADPYTNIYLINAPAYKELHFGKSTYESSFSELVSRVNYKNNINATSGVITASAIMSGDTTQVNVAVVDALPETGTSKTIYVIRNKSLSYWWDGESFIAMTGDLDTEIARAKAAEKTLQDAVKEIQDNMVVPTPILTSAEWNEILGY